jgi:hypothetical protein
MSYEYEKMNINDLYSVLGRIKKGKWYGSSYFYNSFSIWLLFN